MHAKTSTLRSTLLAAALTLSLAGMAGTAQATSVPATYQISELHKFMVMPVMPTGGAVTLTRRAQSLETSVAASNLDANTAYTLWWVVFNFPASCIGGCGLDDVQANRGGASVLYATGFVTGDDGVANVSARLNAGDPPLYQYVRVGNGLVEGRGFAAEVHIVIHTHGPILTGQVAGQLSSFDGVCNPGCMSQQAAVFAPVP